MSADLRAGDGGQTGPFGQLKKADPGPDHRAIRTIRTPEKDARADLRTRLEAMRAHIVAAMVRDGFSAGLGALLAQLAAALDALDKAPQNAAERGNADRLSTKGQSETANSAAFPLSATGALRAILADDNETIRLTLYRGPEALASVPLDPARAVGLAAELCAAARRRLTP